VTTTFFLVRHATHALVDRVLVGRMGGVPLDARGQQQARDLGQQLCQERLTGIQSSPRERALETARAIGVRTRLPIEISDEVDEIDVGGWTGLSFEELASLPDWHCWNTMRGTARPPDGESMAELQARVVRHLEKVHAKYPYGRIAIVTHAEVVRAAILHYLGLSLDQFFRIEVRPATVSILVLGDRSSKVVKMNEAVSA
jgi:probable phosphoglycerate mutase